MAWVVKIIINDDGVKQDKPKWCLVQTHGDTPRTLCTGEVFGYGESSATFKENQDGRVTCPKCIEIIKWFKSIKL